MSWPFKSVSDIINIVGIFTSRVDCIYRQSLVKALYKLQVNNLSCLAISFDVLFCCCCVSSDLHLCCHVQYVDQVVCNVKRNTK